MGASFFPTFDGLPQVATIAAGAVGSGRLVDLPVPTSARSAVVFVQNVKDYFRWNPTDTATADGITIVAALANGASAGRWERMRIPAREWMAQLTWFVDPSNVAASDENDGTTALTPLKTDAERQRRMGPTPTWNGGAYHLRYISDLTEADVCIIAGTRLSSSTIFLHGSATNGQGRATVYTVNADAVVTTLNRATNQPWQIASAGLPVSWTASGAVGKRLRRTNGTAIRGWVTKDLTAKTARCSQFLNPNTYSASFSPSQTTGTPANGDTFVVETLTQIPQFLCTLQQADDFSVNFVGIGLVIESLDVGPSEFRIASSDRICFDGCSVSLWETNDNKGVITFNECKVQNFGQVEGGNINFHAGYSNTQLILGLFGTNPLVLFDKDFTIQGVSGQGIKQWTGVLSTNDFAVFDCTGSAIEVNKTGLIMSAGTFWGANNTQYAFNFNHSGVFVHYASATTIFTVVGALGDISLLGRTSEHAFDDTAGTFTATRACSFANLAATVAAGGFGNSIVSPVNGCGMVGT